MVFEYQDYLLNAFLNPIISTIFFVLICLSAIACFGVAVFRGKISTESVLTTIFFLIVTIICIIPNYTKLANGGIYLLEENENDAIVECGVIETLIEPSEKMINFKSNHKYGADLTIDGEYYFALTCSNFKKGDKVSIRYLPKSHFILEINLLEE